MKRIHFFATKADILTAMDTLEGKAPLTYTLAQHRLHPLYASVAPRYQSLSQFPDLGIAASGQTSRCERYIVASPSTVVLPLTRNVNGRSVTAYELGNCPDCVEFNAGGFWEQKVLINGLVQTWSDSKEAQRLMRVFMLAFRKTFDRRIGVYWIGPEAFEYLKSGGRLTLNVDADPSFDLTLPGASSL
jgi:hypothetical protein